MHIGEKRNKAISAAPAEASVFVMMDDDDHYPAGSVAGRVAWLVGLGIGAGVRVQMTHKSEFALV